MNGLREGLHIMKQELKDAHDSVRRVLHETAKGRRHVADLETRLRAGPHGEELSMKKK